MYLFLFLTLCISKECHKTESLWNHTTTDHKEGEQLEDRRNVGESSCSSGDGTEQRSQFLMFMMMMMMMMMMNSLNVSSTSCPSSGEKNCVNTTYGSCHSVSVAVLCAGRKFYFRPAQDTVTDSYQRLYWHNLSLLMMSTMCSKYAES